MSVRKARCQFQLLSNWDVEGLNHGFFFDDLLEWGTLKKGKGVGVWDIVLGQSGTWVCDGSALGEFFTDDLLPCTTDHRCGWVLAVAIKALCNGACAFV